MNMQAPITLITGGSRGLGRNAAEHLARQGGDVIITYRAARAEADQVIAAIQAQGRRAAAIQLDVGDSGTFAAFVGQLKNVLRGWQRERIDHLINNAGMGVHATIEQTNEAQFDELVRVHLKGPFFLTQALLPLISDGGRIINVSSGLSRFSVPGYAAYAMMKGGLEVMTRYLAKELGARKISVNTLAPGAIETDFGGGRVRDNAELNAFVSSVTAMGRAGQPDDIGGAVAALLAPGSAWINAQRVEASGGMFV